MAAFTLSTLGLVRFAAGYEFVGANLQHSLSDYADKVAILALTTPAPAPTLVRDLSHATMPSRLSAASISAGYDDQVALNFSSSRPTYRMMTAKADEILGPSKGVRFGESWPTQFLGHRKSGKAKRPDLAGFGQSRPEQVKTENP